MAKLFETLTQNSTVALCALVGAALGGAGGFYLSNGVNTAVLATTMGVIGLAGGAYAGKKISEYRENGGASPTPATAGASRAPEQGQGLQQEPEGLGETAMQALNSTPVKVLATVLKGSGTTTGSSTAMGPGSIPAPIKPPGPFV